MAKQILIEFDEKMQETLNFLMKECSIETEKELFNNALTLLLWAVNKRKDGCEIAAIDSKNGRVFNLDNMAALSAVKPNQVLTVVK